MLVKDIINNLSYRVRFGGFIVELVPSEETKKLYEELEMTCKVKRFLASGFQRESENSILAFEKYTGQKNIKQQLITDEMIIDYIDNEDSNSPASKILIVRV